VTTDSVPPADSLSHTTDAADPASNGIGRLRERSLHAALKDYFWQEGDQIEVTVDGMVIDLVHGEQLVEFQTRGLYRLRRKLVRLLPEHPVCVVYPLPLIRWIVTLDADGETMLRRRKSPRRGRPVDLFDEMYTIADLLLDPNMTLKLVLTHEDQIRCDDGRGSWRRKGISIVDRVLLKVVKVIELQTADDVLALVPELVLPATHREIREQLGVSARLAQRISMSLRRLGCIEVVEKRGRSLVFDWIGSPVLSARGSGRHCGEG